MNELNLERDRERRQHLHAFGVAALAVGVLLGIAGDVLLYRAEDIGLSATLWLLATLACFLEVTRRAKRPLTDERKWLLAIPITLFALTAIVRDSPLVVGVSIAVALALGCILAAPMPRPTLMRGSVGSYITALPYSSAMAFIGGFCILAEVSWARIWGPRAARSKWMPWVRGVLIALPVLAMFTLLFMSADAAFKEIVDSTFSFASADVFEHLFVVLFFAWPMMGLARMLLVRGFTYSMSVASEEPVATANLLPERTRLGMVEVLVILGTISALFAIFVAVQLRYLFGGHSLVQERTGLTYAEYAHKGFIELVAVVALTLVLLVVIDHVRWRGDRRTELSYRLPAGLLTVLAGVIVASAMQRLRLYDQVFGITELRLLVATFLGWVAMVLIWLLIVIAKDARDRFAFGSFVAGLVVLAVWVAANPAALVAQRNIGKIGEKHRGVTYDSTYATELSADAVPALLNGLDEMPPASRAAVERALINQLGPDAATDSWREWNVSRARARNLVQEELVDT